MPSAHILSVERTTDDDGTPVTNVVVDLGGGATATHELALAPGDDSPPLPGDVAATVDDGGTGSEFVVGVQDTKNAGTAQPGEKRFYGRSTDGSQVCEFWLKGDGSVRCSNPSGSLELGADGTVTINGVTISPQGEIKAPGEITAMSQSTAVALSTHTHGDAMGGTTPPLPGA
jgi:hypothetical protein